MIVAALRDLQWRWKRFVIAVLGVGLVFAMGLIMTGLSASFGVEADRTLDAMGVRAWAVSAAGSGPFTAFNPVPASAGGSQASPLLVLRQTIEYHGAPSDIIVVGVEPGALGAPRAAHGTDLAASGDAVVDSALGHAGVGDEVSIGGRSFRVVGTVSGQRLYGGIPLVYVPLADLQTFAVGGQPLASAFVYPEVPAAAPPGMRVMSNREVEADVLRPLHSAMSSISFVRLLLWIVAATIIGSMLYLQAMERSRDFAVFKATGTSTFDIGLGLALQAVLLSLAGAVLAALLAVVIAPRFPMPVEVPTSVFVLLPVVTVGVGLLASVVALRKTATVEPALAFGAYVRTAPGDLHIDQLTVEFTTGGDTVRPLDGMTVSVPSGSLALLLGPSGCGKTTLLSCLAAILRPTSGSITFGDTEITGLSGRQLTEHRRHGVGVIFQAFNLVPSLNCIENVAVPMRSAGIGAHAAKARAVELLEQVGLGDRLAHRPGKLSGGQQQRVAIARALALDPPLVLADEPTAHLDYVQVEGVLRLIRGLTDGGRVVVVSTHDDRMLPLADQIIEMRPHSRPPEPVTTAAVDLPPGAVLFRRGDPSDLVYVVDHGTLEVVRDSADGEVVVATLGPGDHVGEMGPLFGLPRSATVRARSAASLTGYSIAAFRDMIGVENLPDLIRGAGPKLDGGTQQ